MVCYRDIKFAKLAMAISMDIHGLLRVGSELVSPSCWFVDPVTSLEFPARHQAAEPSAVVQLGPPLADRPPDTTSCSMSKKREAPPKPEELIQKLGEKLDGAIEQLTAGIEERKTEVREWLLV